MDVLTSASTLSNALSGAVADSVSCVLLYPLSSVKTQMQVEPGTSASEIALRWYKESPMRIFWGVRSSTIKSAQQKFQYFYIYSLLKELYFRRTGKKPAVLVELTIGYLSALGGLATTLPLESTVTRVITASKKSGGQRPSFFDTFMDQLQNEGFLSFYNSIFPAVLLCINPAITYVIFEVLKARLLKARKVQSEVLSTYEALVVSVIAKSIATITTFPLMRAKVMLAVQKKTLNGKEEERGMIETMRQILATEGLQGWYVGLNTQLFKGVTGAAIMLVIKENIYMIIKRLIIGQKK
jgi:hypothetical protein